MALTESSSIDIIEAIWTPEVVTTYKDKQNQDK